MSRPSPSLSVLAFVALAPLSVAGQSVQEVVDGMQAVIDRAAERVQSYTVVQTVMGFSAESYFELQVVDGRNAFVPQGVTAAGMEMGPGEMGFGDISGLADDLIEHGRYDGREDVDGVSAHVLVIDDLSQIELPGATAPDDMEFVPTSGRMLIDADRYVPIRLEFSGMATNETGTHDVTSVVRMTDYREIEGLLVPYHVLVEIEGMGAMIDPEMQAEIDEMMARLEEMDPQQRAMMERMMGPQLEQMRAMAGGDDDTMSIEVAVTDVRVNQGR